MVVSERRRGQCRQLFPGFNRIVKHIDCIYSFVFIPLQSGVPEY